MPNRSDIEKLMVETALSDGVKLGQELGKQVNEAVLSGHLLLPVNNSINVDVNVTNMIQYDFSLRDKILAKIGSPLVMSTGNVGLAVGGGTIMLESGKNFLQANNRVARVFYALSLVCSGTGTVSSTIAVYCEKCGFSKTGMLGDGFGGLFLYAGNKANSFGQIVEGKKPRRNPFLPRGPVQPRLPKFGGGYRGISFVGNSGNFTNISYLELISAGVTIYTTYRCAKLVVKCSKSIYTYVDNKMTPKLNPRHVILFTSEYMIDAFSLKQTYKIYNVALQLHFK